MILGRYAERASGWSMPPGVAAWLNSSPPVKVESIFNQSIRADRSLSPVTCPDQGYVLGPVSKVELPSHLHGGQDAAGPAQRPFS